MYQVFPDRFARCRSAGQDPPRRAGLPDWAVPCDWDTTPVEGAGPQTPVPVLRRGPRRHHREAGPHPGPRGGRHLPDAVLPRPLQPPLRRLHVRRRGPAAGRRPGPGGARRSGPRPRPEGDGRPHRQPLRRRPRMVPARPGRAGLRGGRLLLLRRGPQRLRSLVRRRLAAQAELDLGGPAGEVRPGRRFPRGPLAQAAVQPGRLADRRRQHDRAARGHGPQPGRGPADRGPGPGDQPGRGTAGRGHQRRRPGLQRRTLARRHDVLQLHPAAVVLARRRRRRTSTSSAPRCPGPTGSTPRISWPRTWTWPPPSAGTSGSRT